MASLHDVLKEVLERDFDEKDVDKIVNPEEDITENDRTRSEAESEQDDPGDSYAGSGDFVQNSVGRGAVESFIKNSVYEKYNIDASSVSSFARMTPTEMLSDFGKSVRDLGTIRSDYHAGKMTASEYKSAVNHTRGEIVGKMLEMGSSRKSILEDVFLRSIDVGPEERSVHSFKDLVDAFREDEVDTVDSELSPDTEMLELEPDELEISPDAEVTPDTNNPDAELAEAEADTETDKRETEEPEQAQDQKTESDKQEEQSENEVQSDSESDREEPAPEEQEPELPENDVEPDTTEEPESDSNEIEETDGQDLEKEEPPEEDDDELNESDVQDGDDTEESAFEEPSDRLPDESPEQDNATRVREIYSDIKILNYDKYINPENPAERRITTFRVAYAANMGFPFIIEIGNGWAEPFITKNGGTMVKEGTSRIVDSVQVFIQDKHLFPLLRRVQLFLEAMTAQAMQRYYEKVSEPILQTCDTEE